MLIVYEHPTYSYVEMFKVKQIKTKNLKEIKQIVSAYKKIKSEGQKLALATVINVEKSSYRRTGARMLIFEDGTWIGGISGGCLEGDILKKAKYAIHTGNPTVVRYDTREDGAGEIGFGLGCRGLIDVFISPILGESFQNGIEALKYRLNNRNENILLTIIESDHPLLLSGSVIPLSQLDSIISKDDLTQEINSLVSEVVENQKSKLQSLQSYGLKVFVEFIPPAPRLYLFGYHYDVFPLAQTADFLGWEIFIIAPLNKISKKLADISTKILSPTAKLPTVDKYSAFVLMSHDVKTDTSNLIRVIKHKDNYIGMLGPKTRSLEIFDKLNQEGISIDSQNIFFPVGFDIGAKNPHEISISIVSEIIAFLSKRDGQHLKDRNKPIYS